MWNIKKEEESVRLSVLESMFIEFQKQIGMHMDNEAKLFQEIKNSIKDIANMLTEVQKENEKSLEDLSSKLLYTVEKNFVSKIELQNTLLSYQKDLSLQIAVEKKRSVTELYYIVAAFAAASSLFGWLFVTFKG